jgi:D-tagatose-1,6-bisphosphate aldolase subunit GatZ/KbaZ
MSYLDTIVAAQKNGEARGITSVCSAHPFVLEAALVHGLENHTPVLIEATSNQVNQFGGYTGMTPLDFIRSVGEIANRVGFAPENLILGGDHLGPLVWSGEPSVAAMDKAKRLVHACALAGFHKFHLDCSMPCADDAELPVELIAQRTAELASVVEQACCGAGLPLPRYVVGSEVPPAGGAKAGENHLSTTDTSDAARTIELTHLAFNKLGSSYAWERVIGMVVQPGVEFGDDFIVAYQPEAAHALSTFIESQPHIVYEAHSTDYQSQNALSNLVRDHFAILKVGPALTFAYRKAVFILVLIEKELFTPDECSQVEQALEAAMLRQPIYWQKYYRGSLHEQAFKRKFSMSDRIRYYWTDAQVQKELAHLFSHFVDRPIPLSLVSQYMPDLLSSIRSGSIQNRAGSLLKARIQNILNDYHTACFPAG